MNTVLPILLTTSAFLLLRLSRTKRRIDRRVDSTSPTIYTDTGYKEGIPFQIKLLKIDDKLVEISTAKKFVEMQKAAIKESVPLSITEGFRTFKEQEYFYNCYITKKCNNGNKAAKPGFSNHQLGTALDINLNGEGTKSSVYKWLVKNANNFGFYQTIEEEPWHWVFGNSKEFV